MLDSFIQEQTNQVVSFDKVPANAGQSIQLIALWCQYIGLPFQWANPVDWWDDADINFAAHWDKVVYDPDNAEVMPKRGDIVIFAAALPGCGGLGHATIFSQSVSPLSWEGFDANWGGRSAHLQSHTWAYVLGWFTPHNPSVLEQFIPTPIADEGPADGFEAVAHEAKIVVLRDSPTPLYNLENVSFDSFNQNPVGYGAQGEEVTITAVAQHRLGGTYLMPDINVPQGYKASDCDDYDPPIDIIVPEPVKRADRFPAKPYTVPSNDIVPITRNIPYYSKVSDAVKRQNSAGEVHSNRTYFVYKRLEGMILLAAEPGRSLGFWINPQDLEAPEVLALPAGTAVAVIDGPEVDWRTTYKAFRDKYGNVEPRWFAGLTSGEVIDHEQRGRDLPIQEGQPILISGWFEGPDGVVYGRPDDAAQLFRWYGVDRNNLQKYTPPAAPEPEEQEMRFEDDPTIVETLGGPVVMSIEAEPVVRPKLVPIVRGLDRVFDIVNKNKEKYYGNFIKRS